jgi:glycosyltransferase involved in cell wall biosynthesis
MRILVTVPWGQRLGGAEAMLQTVLAGAGERGHELEFVFFEDGAWPRELREAGFAVEVIEAGRLRELHKWVATVFRLTRIIRRRRPEMVLNWAAKTQLYASPAAVLAGVSDRVVLWQHAIPEGHWLDAVATLLPSAAIGCYSDQAARAQARLRPSRSTFVVAPGTSAPEAGTSASQGQAPAIEPPLPRGVPIVGLVGRLQPWKGQDRLLRAQSILRRRGLSVHLLLVGGDAYGLSPDYAESLPLLANDLGLRDAVTMTGQVPDAGPLIERMDVLVNASDPEPFGIVLLEGMARSVPVVAVDSGGPAEFIDDRETGMLASSGEPDALADALEPLLRSEELRRRIGQAGRRRFLERFTELAVRERFFSSLEAVGRARGARARRAASNGVAQDASAPRGRSPHTITETDRSER